MELAGLAHSFPTRRSSDLSTACCAGGNSNLCQPPEEGLMKMIHFLLAGLMVAVPLSACSAPSDQVNPPTTPTPAPTMVKHASATGTIEAIDPAARTITIAHGPMPELA